MNILSLKWLKSTLTLYRTSSGSTFVLVEEMDNQLILRKSTSKLNIFKNTRVEFEVKIFLSCIMHNLTILNFGV